MVNDPFANATAINIHSFISENAAGQTFREKCIDECRGPNAEPPKWKRINEN